MNELMHHELSGWCPERNPRTGYVCCGRAGHDGDHYVTNGQMEPPGHYVAYTWPRSTSPQPPEKP